MTPTLRVDKRSLLAKVSMFSPLGPPELDRLAQITVVKRLRGREILFRKGDDGSQAYVIISGRLKISSAAEDGKETVLRIMDPGEVVGEMALLDGDPRSATATALEPCELLVIQRRDLIPFLERHPRTAIKLLESQVARVRAQSAQLEDRVFLNLQSRLAKKLLALSDNYGVERPDGITIDLKLSQGDLGEMVGTSRESINKQLRAWVEDGVVKSEKGYITIRNLDALEQLAGFAL